MIQNRYAESSGLSYGFIAILFPVFARLGDVNRSISARQAVDLALADALIRHASTGRWPESTPIRDPFGGALRVRFDGKRFLVWSRGPNGEDDGGFLTDAARAAGKRSDDLVAAFP